MKQISATEQTSRETIRGMVVPAQWNDRFQVTGVLVACRDEREIRVENLETFPVLKELAQKEALFTGVVQKNGNAESIHLESFTPIQPEQG